MSWLLLRMEKESAATCPLLATLLTLVWRPEDSQLR